MNPDANSFPWSRPSYPEIFKAGVVTMGNFDGVHQGHVGLVKKVKEMASRLAIKAIALTFHPPPIKLLKPDLPLQVLTSPSQKFSLLKKAGIDEVCVIETNHDFLSLSPERFFNQVLLQGLQAKGVVEGPDFHFGKNREGNVSLLEKLCQKNGLDFQIVQPVLIEKGIVSSSRIRNLLLEGKIDIASRLLGRPYSIEGIVTRGAERGRTIGFPTANLDTIPTLLPANGVYAGFALVEGNQAQVAIHLGPNPTFGESAQKVEVHLIDFEGDLYGKQMEVKFLERIRGVLKFSSLEALKLQIQSDVTQTRELLNKLIEG